MLVPPGKGSVGWKPPSNLNTLCPCACFFRKVFTSPQFNEISSVDQEAVSRSVTFSGVSIPLLINTPCTAISWTTTRSCGIFSVDRIIKCGICCPSHSTCSILHRGILFFHQMISLFSARIFLMTLCMRIAGASQAMEVAAMDTKYTCKSSRRVSETHGVPILALAVYTSYWKNERGLQMTVHIMFPMFLPIFQYVRWQCCHFHSTPTSCSRYIRVSPYVYFSGLAVSSTCA